MNSIGAEASASTPSTRAAARPCHASHSPAASARHASGSGAGPSPASSPASTASSQASRSAAAIAAPSSAT
ncbi:hypothetical protein [Sphingomonas sp. IC081]|uniref:hypothetical protein n=1 Tax=Sphingomonas sp. IC081 TaxID=304378 RepID=UPI00115826BF|nr:hypothetical protein [Sphingomonas sp. IC081]